MRSRTVYRFAVILGIGLAFWIALDDVKKEKKLEEEKNRSFLQYKKRAYESLQNNRIFDFISYADSALWYKSEQNLFAQMLYYQMIYDTLESKFADFWDFYDAYPDYDSLPLLMAFYDLKYEYCYDAMGEMEEYLDSHSNSSLAYAFYARTFVCNSYDIDETEAEYNLKKAIYMQPDFYAWYAIGEVYKKLEQYKNAINAYKQSIKEDSNYFRAYEKLYLLYKKINRMDSSKFFYLAFIEKVKLVNPYYEYENVVAEEIIQSPDSVIEVYDEVLNSDTGLEYINNILDIQPSNTKALLAGAKLKYKKGIYDAALGDFMDYYDITSEDTVLYYIARCWLYLGNPEMAYETLNGATYPLDEKSSHLKDSLEEVLY